MISIIRYVWRNQGDWGDYNRVLSIFEKTVFYLFIIDIPTPFSTTLCRKPKSTELLREEGRNLFVSVYYTKTLIPRTFDETKTKGRWKLGVFSFMVSHSLLQINFVTLQII